MERDSILIYQMILFSTGGFTENMIKVFESYKEKYVYYGFAGTTGYNENGKLTDSITANYNLTPIFAIIEPPIKN